MKLPAPASDLVLAGTLLHEWFHSRDHVTGAAVGSLDFCLDTAQHIRIYGKEVKLYDIYLWGALPHPDDWSPADLAVLEEEFPGPNLIEKFRDCNQAYKEVGHFHAEAMVKRLKNLFKLAGCEAIFAAEGIPPL